MLRVRLDQLFDLVRALRAFENQRAIFLRKIAEDCEDFVEQLIDPLAARLRVCSHFAKHDYRAISVLVANEISSAVTITFFASKYVKRRMGETKSPCFFFVKIDIIFANVFRKRSLVFAQLRSDVFEAGERFHASQTVV